MANLRQWRETWRHLGVSGADDAEFETLVSRYSEPHRKYHTMRHLDECFEKLRAVEGDAIHLGDVELGLWFHDAIYDTMRHDNEARSADWARRCVLDAGLAPATAEHVHTLIMATCHDAVPRETDEKILVDVDLSILGATSERFDEYERQVREEYSWVPDTVFRAKRRAILLEFLARPTIFNTDKFIAAYETSARQNLERSIER